MKLSPLILAVISLSACYGQKQTLQDTAVAEKPKTDVRITSQEKINKDAILTEKQEEATLSLEEINWQYFSGKYDIDIELGEGQAYNGTLSFRMKRDSVFWFSISASIGFQIAKGIIIRDTLHALDQLQKNYYRIPLLALQSSTQLPANIGALQRLFSGEALTKAIYYKPITTRWHADTGLFKGYEAAINSDGFITQNAIKDEVYKRYLYANYDNRSKELNSDHSVTSSFSLILQDALNTIRLQVRLKTSSFEPIPSYPFYVPNGYTLVESW
jgi:hypothetical protein